MDDSLSLSVLSDIPLDLEARLAWLIEREEQLAEIIASELSSIVTQVYDEFLATLSEPEQLEVIIASGDIERLGDIVPRWRMAIGRNIQPYLEQIYLSGGISAYLSAPGTNGFTEEQAGAWADVVNQVAVEYTRSMTNRLVGVGETAWKMIRGKVTKAIEGGASNEVLRNELINIGQFSEFRADVIARTEVQFAYSNGNWQAGQALGEFGPVEKEWLAASDGRTRRSHANINGTRLPINQPFQMSSGAQMMYPHDPSAPARETVQCRCVLLEFYAGDVRPDGSIVGRDALPVQDSIIENTEASQRRNDLSDWSDKEIEDLSLLTTSRDAVDDPILYAVADRQGFTARPTTISGEEFARQAADPNSDYIAVYRGIGGDKRYEYIEQFRSGDYFAGKGMYGNGTYTTDDIGSALQYTAKTRGAQDYDPDSIMRILIPKNAKLATSETLLDEYENMSNQIASRMSDLKSQIKNTSRERSLLMRSSPDADVSALTSELQNLEEQLKKVSGLSAVTTNFGRFAAMKGYDGILLNQGTETYHIMFNRSILRVVR